MVKLRTHYDNLSVSRNAPESDIKIAYKVLCQRYHPDKCVGGVEEALRIMKVINGAYVVLSDPLKRAKYDQWIDRHERLHSADKIQRLNMHINAATRLTPPKNFLVSYWVTINQFWKNVSSSCCSIVQLITGGVLKRIKWILGGAGVVGIVLTVTIFYMSDLKTARLAHQDTEETLTKIKQLIKQGREPFPLYLQLAKQGNADAQFNLGLIYVNGQGVVKDDKQAVRWFGKAAEQGHMDAQTKLGFMYATGKGVEQDYNSAAYWCYKAAEQGDVTAQYNLGLMYAKGQGMIQDDSLAFSWYSKAAAQGDARAQYHLGDMYANGVGVAKNVQQAAMLYRKAAKQGLAEAVGALRQIRR